jgi:hypothetical protein
MKIIAKINGSTVLCEVSANEIARLRGYTSIYDDAWRLEYLDVGREHDLVSAFEALDTLRSLDAKAFHDVAKSLKQLTESFDRAHKAHEALMLFDTLK